MKHFSWDLNACNDAIASVFGWNMIQKSTKTYCGKRVAMKHVSNDSATCPGCLAARADELEGQRLVAEYCREHGIS